MEKNKRVKLVDNLKAIDIVDQEEEEEFDDDQETMDIETPGFNMDNNYDNRLVQDSQILHGLLPAVVWDHNQIAGHLADNPDNVETLLNCSPYFREMLKDRRVLFLSKKVLKIFINWRYPKFLSNRSLFDQQRFGRNQGLFEVLKWRQVCSSWCSSIDQLLNTNLIDCRPIADLGHFYGNEGKLKLTKFLKYFEATHETALNGRSPFIGGYLHIFVYGNREDCWNELFCLLRIYGHHIWHMRYGSLWDEDAGTPEEFYLKFRQLLTLIPNLSTVNIHYNNYSDKLPDEIVKRNPPPRLLHLKKLDVDEVPIALFPHLLRNNDHISSLRVDYKKEYSFDVELINLNKFDVISCTHRKNGNFRNFIPPPPGAWPIKILRWNDVESKKGIKWGKAFKIISEAWGNTLEEVELALPDAMGESRKMKALRDSLICRLNLPKVKLLVLRLKENICAFDFLLGMDSLETLKVLTHGLNRDSEHYRKINKDAFEEAKEKQIVHWVGHEEKMFKSNIWTLFGNLKTLRVFQRLYLRRNCKNCPRKQ